MRVHQMHFSFIPGDAICNQMIEIDARLRAWGLETSIFAHHIAPEMSELARPDREYLTHLRSPEDLLIFHYGLYHPNVRYFQAARGPKILVYHNITPACFFRGWNRELELLCDVGRRTLPSLTDCDLALGDSEFNRQELIQAGFSQEKTDVLPLFLTPARLDARLTTGELLDRPREPGTVAFLTVGRVVPNKAIEDVIRIFAVYHQAVDPGSRLYVVGPRYLPAYDAALDALVATLGLRDEVVFTGLTTDTNLKAHYQAADLYLHASHHEGFCLPLLESMHFGIPILAREAAAVPETLGDAGVLFTHLGYEEAAEMAHLLITDPQLRAHVVSRQKERLEHFAPSRVEARLREMLGRLGVFVPEPTPSEDSAQSGISFPRGA